MINNLVSIIIPSYNKELYIRESILSVVNQTYQNWELIIIDDLSIDNTIEIIREFCRNEKRISYFINSKNSGANYSRNLGLEKALGEYILFFDADDILLPNCLKERVENIVLGNYDFCVFSMGVFKNKIGDSSYVWKPNSNKPLNDFMQHKLPWSILQPIWKASFLKSFKGFDESFSRFQDVELHTRILFTQPKNYRLVVSEPDCYYRIDEARKNYSPYIFIEHRINSTILYYSKFYEYAKPLKLQRLLCGTVYSTYLQLIFALKNKTISEHDFRVLDKKLASSVINLPNYKLLLFKFSKKVNLSHFKLPGFNYCMNFIFTRF